MFPTSAGHGRDARCGGFLQSNSLSVRPYHLAPGRRSASEQLGQTIDELATRGLLDTLSCSSHVSRRGLWRRSPDEVAVSVITLGEPATLGARAPRQIPDTRARRADTFSWLLLSSGRGSSCPSQRTSSSCFASTRSRLSRCRLATQGRSTPLIASISGGQRPAGGHPGQRLRHHRHGARAASRVERV